MFSWFRRDGTPVETSPSAAGEKPRELVFTAALEAYLIGYAGDRRREKADVAVTEPRRWTGLDRLPS